jgi:hypothetical protein
MGSLCVSPVVISILADLRIPVALHYNYVFIRHLVKDSLELFIKVLNLTVIIVCCWGIGLDNGDVERSRSHTDGDKSA